MNVYSLDTTVFITPYKSPTGKGYYHFDVVPHYWEWLENLAEKGEIFVASKVAEEIEVKGDKLCEWFKANKLKLVRNDNEPSVQEALGRVMECYGTIEAIQKAKADPYVIAHALAGDDLISDVTVVTEEKSSGSEQSLKIPDICDKLGIKHITIFEFLEACNFTTRR